ncbi:hypothetical protein [Streptomyces sp. NPDC059080]
MTMPPRHAYGPEPLRADRSLRAFRAFRVGLADWVTGHLTRWRAKAAA